jgi:hypothetical protein
MGQCWALLVRPLFAMRQPANARLTSLSPCTLALSSYLLSSHPPPLEGLAATLTPRVHLYGSSSTPSVSGPLDVDGIILTETIEYALSLVPVLKGQEQFAGIPYLQPYKLLHALILIENGETAKSQR